METIITNIHPEMFAKLLLAALLGGLVGLERDIHGRAAGLRTHMLVALGAALFMIISIIIAKAAGMATGTNLRADPGRIAAQIVTGVGFLGAGAIMKEGFTVRGLTTAACFWVVAAVGMASGAGEYSLAVSTTVISLFALTVLNHADRFYKRDSYRILAMALPLETNIGEIIELIKRKDISIVYVDFKQDYETGKQHVRFAVRIHHKGTTDKMSRDIIQSLVQARVPLSDLSWTHGKMY
jgi:putative Mg2+ transporter-C (MgtC) family protein